MIMNECEKVLLCQVVGFGGLQDGLDRFPQVHQGLVQGGLLVLGPGGGVKAVQLGDRLANPLNDGGGVFRELHPLLPARLLLVELFLVNVPGCHHTSVLLFSGDLDQNGLYDLRVAAARVPDFLG